MFAMRDQTKAAKAVKAAAEPATGRQPGPATRRIVRVAREGFRRVFHPTIEELETAIDAVTAEAERITWNEVRFIEDFYGARVQALLGVAVTIERAGTITATGGRLLAIATAQVGPVHLELTPELVGGARPATTATTQSVAKTPR